MDVRAARLIWAFILVFIPALTRASGSVEWERLTVGPGSVPGNQVERVALDSDFNLWLTTRHSGAAVYDGKRWYHYGTEEGLPGSSYLLGLAVGRGNLVAFGSFGNGVSLVDHRGTLDRTGDDLVTRLGTADGLLSNDIVDLVFDEAGNLWIGFAAAGLQVYTPDGELVSFSRGPGTLASSSITDLLPGGPGVLWIGLGQGNGVNLFDSRETLAEPADDRWLHLNSAGDGLLDDHVRVIKESPEGAVWFGTAGGIGILDHAGFPFDRRKHRWRRLSGDDGLSDVRITAIDFDNRGNAWIGTETVLERYNTADRRVTTYNPFNTAGVLSGNGINDLAYDQARNALWVATDEGLCRYRPLRSAGSAGDVVPFPNPCRISHGCDRVSFRSSLEVEELRIYTVTGDLVRTIRGIRSWDLRDNSGRRVTGGTFLFWARLEGGRESRGIIAITR